MNSTTGTPMLARSVAVMPVRWFVLAALIAVPAWPAELLVDGADPACDDATGAPFCSIGAALGLAVTDDIVSVAAGTYAENVGFNGKAVTLLSQGGPQATVINGQGGTTVVIGPMGRIEGFTITGGFDSFGAGMDVIGTGAVIKGNIFDGNVETAGGYGAAIGGNNASATIDGNVFVNNSCDSQFLSGTISFVNTSSPVIVNNVFVNNNCRGVNMTLPQGNQPRVINNLFVGNPSGIYFDRRVDVSAQTYRNNIVVGNAIGIEVNFGSDADNPAFANNDVFGNTVDYSGISNQTGSNGNISSDPLFVDSAAGDFRLLPGSPAIDTASNEPEAASDIRLLGRPVDGDGDLVATPDMGAYEAAPAVAVAGPDQSVSAGVGVTLDGSASIEADAPVAAYLWTQVSGSPVALTNAQTATAMFSAPAAAASLVFRLQVTDALGFVTSDEVTVAVAAPPPPAPPPPAPPPRRSGGGSADLLLVALLLLAANRRVRRRAR